MTHRDKTITGITWSAVGQFGSQAIRYGVLLVLAWLLSPTDFGLVGLAMLFILFTQTIGELGLLAAVVQKKEVTNTDLNTAFWSNLSLSFLMAALTYLSAEPITAFLGDVKAAPLLKALSVIFPMTALAVIPNALLQKQLDFKQLSKVEVASEVAFGIVGLTMAFTGAGVWSLVAAAMAQRLASTFMLWALISWWPKFEFNMQSLRKLMGFGLNAMIASILARGVANVDYFVVGRWLGAEALGYYTLAFQLAVVPARRLIGILRRAAFPSFSLVQDDLERLKKGFLDGVRYLFLILVPLSHFLIVVAPSFIKAVYGQKWEPTIQTLQFLSIASLFYGFDIAEALYFAVGQPKVRIWIIAARLALFALFVSNFGLFFGIEGVAVSLALSVALTSLAGFFVVAKIVKISFRETLQPVWLAIQATWCAYLPILLLNQVLPEDAPWLEFILLSLTMPTIYLLLLIYFKPSLLNKIIYKKMMYKIDTILSRRCDE